MPALPSPLTALAAVSRRLVRSLPILALAALALAGAARAACDGDSLPSEDERNIWHCYNGSDTVIVFIHGVNSSIRSAWYYTDPKGDKSKDRYWPNMVLKDAALQSPSVFLAGYHTGLDAGNYSIHDSANEVYAPLTANVGGNPPVLEKKNILFVAHSMGGIVVRDILINHKEVFEGKKVGLLLVASPSFGSRKAATLFEASSIANHKAGQELSWGSSYLKTLDGQFKDLLATSGIKALVGQELYEQYPLSLARSFAGNLIGGGIDRLFGTEPIVVKESAVRYFGSEGVLVGGSDHTTISKPPKMSYPSHVELEKLYERVKQLDRPYCRPPEGMTVALKITTPQDLSGSEPFQSLRGTDKPNIVLRELAPDEEQKYLPPRDRDTGHYSFNPGEPFPCPGSIFEATIYRSVASGDSEYQTGFAVNATKVCFKRSLERPNAPKVQLNCTEGAGCTIDDHARGMASECGQHARLDRDPDGRRPAITTAAASAAGLLRRGLIDALVPPAVAQTAPAETVGSSRWVVPSLETIAKTPLKARKGYVEFEILTDPVQGTETADRFSVKVSVNGVPLYFDGEPPHSVKMRYSGADGIYYVFGAENLGFTGGSEGLERIEVEFRFYDASGAELPRVARLARDYVSYRHAKSSDGLALDQGEHAEWRGLYRPSEVADRFEVMLASTEQLAQIQSEQQRLGRLNARYGKAAVVGVIRPPRTDNPRYGLTLGMREESGQIRSSFPRAEAVKVCRWLFGGSAGKAVRRNRSDTYLYEFKVENFTEDYDRGVYAGECRRLLGARSDAATPPPPPL
jgi:pimeloyl-ACP methyl ester carboxylesterase